MLDSREKSVSILVGLTWLLQILDGISAVQMMQVHGLGSELNPVVRTTFLHAGLLGVAAAKAAVAAPLGVLFARLARRGQRRLARTGLVTAAVLGLLGCVSNLLTGLAV
jgi:hypothetical protein